MTTKNHAGCYGCLKPENGDRVRDSSGQFGYGRIWAINEDGTASVQFDYQGPVTMRLTQLEFVSRQEGK